jgi:hypothetical protein
MRCFGEPIRITNHGPHPWPGDFDGDGRPDLITCVEWSVYPYYSHTALAMSHRPQYTIELIPKPGSSGLSQSARYCRIPAALLHSAGNICENDVPCFFLPIPIPELQCSDV